MAIMATIEALSVRFLASRTRGKSFRVGRVDSGRDGGRLNLVSSCRLVPLRSSGLIIAEAMRGILPRCTTGRARSNFETLVVITVAGFVAVPRRRTGPLPLPSAAVVVVKRLAANRELVLPVSL
jgi:hypothetical protein